MGRSTPRWTALAIGLVLGASLVATTPAPVAAAPDDSDTLVFIPVDHPMWGFVRNGAIEEHEHVRLREHHLAGDFSAAPGTGVFLYASGTAPDGIVHIRPVAGGGVTTRFVPRTVTGSYTPVVGDFDGNAVDDVLWYAVGTAPDSIWLFAPDGSYTSVPIRVDGSYTPIAIEANGDGYDDVLWYGFGSDPDSMWLFGAGASRTKKSVRINGRYQTFTGHFRDVAEGSPQEQLVFHDVLGPDSMWTFDTDADHTSRPLPDVGFAEPVVGSFLPGGRDAIFWYRQGPASETIVTFDAQGAPTVRTAASVTGEHVPVVGDLDGDGLEDIAWTLSGRAFVWRLGNGGASYTQTYIDTGITGSVATVARTDPADL